MKSLDDSRESKPLKTADGAGDRRLVHVAGLLDAGGMLLAAVFTGIVRSVFVLDSRMSVHRTALVLIAYLVVHMVRATASLALSLHRFASSLTWTWGEIRACARGHVCVKCCWGDDV